MIPPYVFLWSVPGVYSSLLSLPSKGHPLFLLLVSWVAFWFLGLGWAQKGSLRAFSSFFGCPRFFRLFVGGLVDYAHLLMQVAVGDGFLGG